MADAPDIVLPALGSPNRAVFLAELIKRLRNTNPEVECNRWFDSRLSGRNYSTFTAGTDNCPSWYFVKNGQQAILAIDGTATWAQAENIALGYIRALGPEVDRYDNPFTMGAARSIIAALSDRVTSMPPQPASCGWSIGGAIAAMIPGLPEWRQAFGTSWEIDTFGAPRPYAAVKAGRSEGASRMIRWMNDNDPVPLIPPRSSELPTVAAILTLPGALRAQNFVHSGMGVSIQENGVTTPMLLPARSQLSFSGSLSQWLRDHDANDPADHHIATYIKRLIETAVLAGNRVADFRQRIEPIGNAQNHGLQRHVANLNIAIARIERQQNQAPQVIPPRLRFRAVRLSRVWYVFFGDAQVAIPGTRRAAHGLAREGNMFVARMQRTAVVDPQAVITAFQTYLQAATDPQSGISPTMNDVIPQIVD